MELEITTLSEVSQVHSERQRSRVFSHTWERDPEDECIHKLKHGPTHTHTHTHTYRTFTIVGLFDGTRGRRERK
jgi:hypothetical protein